MAAFDFIEWGNTKIVGHWVVEGSPSPSGVYRGQCTQVVTQFLKDFGYSGWNAARGNGNQVGASMVARGEAMYVGTNLASIPAGEIHVICKDVGVIGADGHVSVAGVGDTVYEQNVRNDQPTHDYSIGPTYSGRLGRLSEAWRGTRYHYKVIVEGDFDDIGGDGGDPTDPDDGADGPNQNRYFKKYVIDVQKKSINNAATKTHKTYQPVRYYKRGIGN